MKLSDIKSAIVETQAIDFSDIEGLEELSILVIKREALPWGVAKRLESYDDYGFDEAEDVMARFIVEWNVEQEDGSPMPLPSVDPTVFNEIPARLLQLIQERIFAQAEPPN